MRKPRRPRKIDRGHPREAIIAKRYFPIDEYEARFGDRLRAELGVGTAAFEQNFILHDDGVEIITHSPMVWW